MTQESQTKPPDGQSDAFVSVCAGTSFVKRRPCFSPNSKYLFVVANADINVYNTSTGELVAVLRNGDDEIASIFLNPRNGMQLLTVSVNGVVTFWDYEDSILIREISLRLKPVCCAFPGKSSEHFYAVKQGKDSSRLYSVATRPQLSKRRVHDSVSTSDGMISFSSVGNVAIVCGCYLNIITGLQARFANVRHMINDSMAFTCVTWHPLEECVATGDNIGRIILWYNWSELKKTCRVSLHWHSLPVAGIHFTAEGSHLYSGAGESVLVKWMPESQMKSFLPRLGMPICSVVCSPNNSVVAVSHVDNSISLVSANNEVLRTINGLAFSHHWEESPDDILPTGLLYEPHSQSIVLNGKTGHLQFYGVLENKHLYNLDITQQNYISRERNRVILHLEVIKAAFDQFGNWLATVESRIDSTKVLEIRLKFYFYQESEQQYSLWTTIEMPHEKRVNCLLFRPSSSDAVLPGCTPLAVTTSDEGKLKFWNLSEHINPGEMIWTCCGTGYYRDIVPGSASFSEDGSVLAVAFGDVLTLWIPESNTLKGCLLHRYLSEPIKQVVFGRKSCSYLVTASTSDYVAVWDTRTFSVLWSVQVKVSFMAGDLASNKMAVFSTSGDLFIFEPSSPKPIFVGPQTTKKEVIAAIFLPCIHPSATDFALPWLRTSQLYFIDSTKKLYTISKKVTDECSVPSDNIKKGMFRNHAPLTPYGMLVAESRKSGVDKIEQKLLEVSQGDSKEVVRMMLSTPCHLLPALPDLCDKFFDSLLKPGNTRSTTKEVRSRASRSEDDSDEMEIDGGGSDSDAELNENSKEYFPKMVTEDAHREAVDDTIPESVEQELKAITKEDYSWFLNSALFT